MRRIRRNRKKYNKKFFIVLFLLFLGIGFSTTATTLYLNNSTEVGKNTADFSVIFTKAKIGDKNITNSAIGENGAKLVISTNDLSEVGDSTTIDYVVTNLSSEYDASVNVSCSSENNYDYYSINNSPSSFSLNAKDKTTGRLIISLASAKSEDDNIICSLSSTAGERTSIVTAQPRNTNIVSVLKYDQNSSSDDYCVTGEEDTCSALDTDSLSKYDPGTIVKYKVNSTDTLVFNVLHDDGDTVTLQYIKNVLVGTPWCDVSVSSEFEPTFLPELETYTNTWTNVNDLDYSIGDNNSSLGYSNCSAYNDCSATAYTLSKSGVKARIATASELYNTVGSGSMMISPSSGGVMPVWMYNYLSGCSNFNCSNDSDDSSSQIYYTFSVKNGNSNSCYGVINQGLLVNSVSCRSERTDASFGPPGFRPVVEINK